MQLIDNHALLDAPKSAAARPAWPILSAIVVTLVAYSLFLAPPNFGATKYEWIAGFLMGVVFSAPAMFGVWAALGTGSILYRLPLTAATLTVLIFAYSFKSLSVWGEKGTGNGIQMDLLIAFSATFVVATAAFLLIRRFTGLRIVQNAETEKAPVAGYQFGMKYLLGWMTILALLLIIGRAFETRLNIQLADAFQVVAIILLLLLPAATLPILALSHSLRPRITLAVILLWPLSLRLAIEMLPRPSLGPSRSELIPVVFMLQVGATLTGACAALALRIAGFRLLRIKSTGSSRASAGA